MRSTKLGSVPGILEIPSYFGVSYFKLEFCEPREVRLGANKATALFDIRQAATDFVLEKAGRQVVRNWREDKI